MQAARELAQFRRAPVPARSWPGRASPAGPGRIDRPGLGELEGQRQRDESLLGAVVQIALDSAPLGVPGGHDPGPGCADVLELGADLGLEPLVVERQARRRRHGSQEFRLLHQRRIVDQQRDGVAVPLEPRHGAGGVRSRGDLERSAVTVDEVSRPRHRVGDLERRVTQRLRQHLPERGLIGLRPELEDEVGDATSCDASSREPDEEADRHERGRGHGQVLPQIVDGEAVEDVRRRHEARARIPRRFRPRTPDHQAGWARRRGDRPPSGHASGR